VARTLSEIITDAINSITAKNTSMGTAAGRSGSVVRDIVVDVPAEEFSRVYEDQDLLKKLQSVNYVDDLTEDELDDLASNYDLTRIQGTSSSGVVTFKVRDFGSPADGYVDIEIPAGSEISAPETSTRSRITFTTTATVTMYASSYGSYFNAATGYYEIQANVGAATVGADTNVSSGQINEIVSVPVTVVAVTNASAFTGGTDVETNTELASRIKERLKGNNKGTKSGYKNTVDDNTGVEDSIVIGPNDTEMTRNQFGGSVDVVVVGTDAGTVTDSFTYTDSLVFTLLNPPFISLTSISAIPLGDAVARPLVAGEYSVTEDSSAYAGSTQEQTKVTVTIALKPYSAVSVTYSKNQLIVDLQTTIDTDENHIIAADILIKEAILITLDISFSITIFSGYDLDEVIGDVKSYVTAQIASTVLGAKIDKSDVVSWAYSASDGIDSVDLSTLIFTADDVIVSEVDASKLEYTRVGTMLINGR